MLWFSSRTRARCRDNVIIAGSTVVKVLGFDGIPFDARAIVAAMDQSEDPLPKGN